MARKAHCCRVDTLPTRVVTSYAGPINCNRYIRGAYLKTGVNVKVDIILTTGTIIDITLTCQARRIASYECAIDKDISFGSFRKA